MKEREATLDAGDYLLQLSQVAADLFELGGRRAARWLLYGRFLKDLQHLAFDARVRIGLQLLEWEIAARDDFEAMHLLEKLTPEFDGLQYSDERKWSFTKLQIKALDMACAYEQAKSTIKDAINSASEKDKLSLEAELTEMQLLQGDFLECEA